MHRSDGKMIQEDENNIFIIIFILHFWVVKFILYFQFRYDENNWRK